MSGEADKPGASAAETIFLAALALSAPERSTYLAGACGDNEQLRQRVESLLRVQDGPVGFLPEQHSDPPAEGPPLTTFLTAHLTEQPGDMIGRYKLRQKIGEGGCGVVYLAEQEEPVRRKVALKVIKLGMDTRQVVARFEAERQALALMDHPNIARVIDAGATETGRPYFVMELVGGIKITDYCEQNDVDTRQRLDLFIKVCHAIQHAHQKGIIHRDIKPSNVLVGTQDGVPVPKVIDFGIAKATQGKLTDRTLFTAFEQFIGTPAYMSPEQAQLGGLDVDTRSDIYSLGVLLYELLTGKTPFDSSELLASGLEGMRRTIQEREPPTPSTRLKQELVAADMRKLKTTTSDAPDSGEEIRASSRRLLQTKDMVKALRGDLDWIVMKCLEKDRARRYETANGLATDVQRHLNNDPVVASPPGNLYRFQKLVRRNKLAFTAAAAIAASLLIGIGVSTLMFLKEREAKREQAHLRLEAQSKEQKAKTEAAKSEQVAQILKDMLQGIAPEVALGRDTTLLKEILDKTAARVGRDLTDQPEVEIELRNTLAWAYREIGLTQQMQDMARKSVEIARLHFGNDSPMLAEALNLFGDALRINGKLEQAEAITREAVALARRLGDKQQVARALEYLGYVLQSRDKLAENEAACFERLEIVKSLGESVEIADILDNLGWIHFRRGDYGGSESLFRESLAMYRKFNGEEAPIVAGSLHNLGEALQAEGKLEEAERTLRTALAIKLKNRDRREFGTITVLMSVLRREGKRQAQDEVCRDWLQGLRTQEPLNEQRLADALMWRTTALFGEARFDAAQPLACECLTLLNKKDSTDCRIFSLQTMLGFCLLGQGSNEEGASLLFSGLQGMSRRANEISTEHVVPIIINLHRALKFNQISSSSDLMRKCTEAGREWYHQQLEGMGRRLTTAQLNNIAWLLATSGTSELRDGATAVALAEKAVAETGRTEPNHLDTLAAAYAESGLFESAVSTQKEALALLQNEGQKRDFETRLQLYKSNTPYRTP